MLLNSNPQAKQILNMLNGTTSEDAKSKVLNMAQNGQINQQQLNQFINFAKQMGLNDQQINELNQKILAENKLLKDKLRAVFNIQNKNKQS